MRVCAAAETKVHDPIEIPELGDVLEAEVAQMLPEFHGERRWRGGRSGVRLRVATVPKIEGKEGKKERKKECAERDIIIRY